jgi:hypothetical protein
MVLLCYLWSELQAISVKLVYLINLQSAFINSKHEHLENILHKLIHDKLFYLKASENAQTYINTQKGASQKILFLCF